MGLTGLFDGCCENGEKSSSLKWEEDSLGYINSTTMELNSREDKYFPTNLAVEEIESMSRTN